MTREFKLQEFFAGRKYSTVNDLLSHAAEISSQIKPIKRGKPTPFGPRNLSPFHRRVFSVAPKFLSGHYDHNAIALELAKEDGIEVTPHYRRRVGSAISQLVDSGFLPKSQPYARPAVPVLRSVSSEEVAKNAALVHQALNHGVSYRGKVLLSGQWRESLSYDDAFQIGFNALRRAMERHDAAKSKLSTYAMPAIGNTIRSAADRAAKHEVKRVSFDARKNEEALSVGEKLGELAFDPEELESKLSLLLRSRRLKPQHLVVWTLHHVFGHSGGEISKFFGVSFESARQSKCLAEKYLAKELAK